MFSCHIKTYGKPSAKNIIIFPGVAFSQKYGTFLGYLFAACGYQAHVLYYSSNIFGSHPKDIRENITHVVQKAEEYIKKNKKRKINWYVFGTSLGSVMALKLSHDLPRIEKTVINLCPSSLSSAILSWNNPYKKIKETYLKHKDMSKKIVSELSQVSPSNNITQVKKQEILFYMAKNDSVFPYDDAKSLLSMMEEKGSKVTAVINDRHNHQISEAINIFKTETYLNFLK